MGLISMKRADDLTNIIADSRRQIQLLEKHTKEQRWIRDLAKKLKAFEKSEWEAVLAGNRAHAYAEGIRDFDYINVLYQAMCLIYGDPRTMENRQHGSPWWNPSPHKISIKCLDLKLDKDTNGKFYTTEYIDPGEVVFLPDSVTVGGKSSIICGVAPQLKAINLPYIGDSELDLQPTSFSEWCYFTDITQSKCCRKNTAWNDASNQLFCMKCKKPCLI